MSELIHDLGYLDFMLLGCMGVFAAFGFMRGFARTLAGVVGAAISVVGAFLGAGLLTSQLASYLRGILAQGLASQISGSQELLDQLAGSAVIVLQSTILRPMVFILCYLLIMVFWLYACNNLNVLAKFHSLKKLDQFVGALCGLAKGFIVLCVSIYGMKRFGVLPHQVLDDSILVQRVTAIFLALAG